MTSAELITELRAARPTAGDALRERVAAISSAADRPPQPSLTARLSRRLSLRRLTFVAVPATAVVLLAVAGVAGLLDSGTSPRSIAVGRSSLESSAGTMSKAAPSPTRAPGVAPPDAATPAPTPGRAQRYSAALILAVKDTDALSRATQQALQITRDLGGYLVTASYATAGTGVSSLTLKVPTTQVQDAVARLTALGTIVSQQVQIDDLQEQVDALAKAEAALRAQIARLSARLAESGLDAPTRATLVARRDAARSELARTRASAAQVDAEARFATIQLSLQTTQESAVPTAPSRWDRGLDRAGEILAVEATVILLGLVVVGPFALVALVALLVRRAARRRDEERLLAAP